MAVFEDAMAELIASFQADAAIDIIYHRGVDSVALVGKAWVGRTRFRIADHAGSRLIFSDRDYLIPVADLVLNTVPIEPAENDWIEQVVAGITVRFEMMKPKGEPTWRFSDPQRTIYRIHTKRVVHT